jgi:general L-amino acid transport system substrate-binding protein
MDPIKQKGTLRCGVNTGLLGFSAPDSAGQVDRHRRRLLPRRGAAILGDANKVQYVPTNAQNRFTALQSGEVDMLSRNTTWTRRATRRWAPCSPARCSTTARASW